MFRIETREQRDALVRDYERKMEDAKRRGTFWFPSPEQVLAIKNFDRNQ